MKNSMEKETGNLKEMFDNATPEQRKGMIDIIAAHAQDKAAEQSHTDWTDEYKAKERNRTIFWGLRL